MKCSPDFLNTFIGSVRRQADGQLTEREDEQLAIIERLAKAEPTLPLATRKLLAWCHRRIEDSIDRGLISAREVLEHHSVFILFDDTSIKFITSQDEFDQETVSV